MAHWKDVRLDLIWLEIRVAYLHVKCCACHGESGCAERGRASQVAALELSEKNTLNLTATITNP